LDARRLEGAPNDVLGSPARVAAVTFKLMRRHHPHAGAVCKRLLTPLPAKTTSMRRIFS
jgi:hypothetical protein